MNDHSLIIGLESRLLNAWPSFDYQLYDGWVLRLANGYSKRANSATPFRPDIGLDDELLDYMIARFVEANVRPTFRLNGVEAPDADALLKQRGFKEIEPTHVLTAPIRNGDCEADPEVSLEPQVSKRWVRAAAESYGGDKSDDETLMRIVSRIRQKAAFATLSLDDRPVAWGLGQGAHTAYLQVREENEIARSLYGALGFETAYRYTHRVMPGRSSSV
jgi:hypothetical protein